MGAHPKTSQSLEMMTSTHCYAYASQDKNRAATYFVLTKGFSPNSLKEAHSGPLSKGTQHSELQVAEATQQVLQEHKHVLYHNNKKQGGPGKMWKAKWREQWDVCITV